MGSSVLKRLCSVSIAAAIVALSASSVFADGDNDWELWTGFKVKAPVNKDISLFVYPQMRYDEDWNHYYYWRYDVGPSITIDKSWRVEPFYRFVRTKSSSDVVNHSDLLSTDLYYTLPFAGKFEFENRVRWEFNFDGDRQACRDRVKVSMKLESMKNVKLFASDEIIYDLSNGDLKENRASIGVSKKFDNGISMDVAYQLTSRNKSSDWNDSNTLVLNFGYTL